MPWKDTTIMEQKIEFICEWRTERMHRDLKAACAKPSAHDLKAQQRRLNRFVKEYNHVRPHEALEMNVIQF